MFYVYDENGNVTQSANVSNKEAYRQVLEENNLSYVESDDFIQDEITWLHVVDGVLQLRPVMGIVVEATNSIVNLSNVPVGAELLLDGLSLGIINDGSVELGLADTGRYLIALQLEPYRFWTLIHEVV